MWSPAWALDVEIDALAVESRRVALEYEMAWRLMRLPGVGPIVAAAIVGYIRDSGRFSEAIQVTRYDGPDASVHQFGEEDWQGGVKKRQPALLRRLPV